jgi:hypothetical protein
MNARLDAAYRATSYVVFGPEGRFTIRVDSKTPLLDDLLTRHETRFWAYVTACNPGSTPLSEDENRRRMAWLEERVRETAHPYFTGEGIGDDAAWPAEPSLLIVGIDAEAAAALGRQFGQAAILVGERGAAAHLLWL